MALEALIGEKISEGDTVYVPVRQSPGAPSIHPSRDNLKNAVTFVLAKDQVIYQCVAILENTNHDKAARSKKPIECVVTQPGRINKGQWIYTIAPTDQSLLLKGGEFFVGDFFFLEKEQTLWRSIYETKTAVSVPLTREALEKKYPAMRGITPLVLIDAYADPSKPDTIDFYWAQGEEIKKISGPDPLDRQMMTLKGIQKFFVEGIEYQGKKANGFGKDHPIVLFTNDFAKPLVRMMDFYGFDAVPMGEKKTDAPYAMRK